MIEVSEEMLNIWLHRLVYLMSGRYHPLATLEEIVEDDPELKALEGVCLGISHPLLAGVTVKQMARQLIAVYQAQKLADIDLDDLSRDFVLTKEQLDAELRDLQAQLARFEAAKAMTMAATPSGNPN